MMSLLPGPGPVVQHDATTCRKYEAGQREEGRVQRAGPEARLDHRRRNRSMVGAWSEPRLTGLTVLSIRERRATEMAGLIRRHGGEPPVAPSMREVPLQDNPRGARSSCDFWRRAQIDVVILLTGVGTRALTAALERACPPA